MRILIVEDERAFAQVLAQGLAAEGYVVDTVHDGRNGYLMAATGAYGAVVLDLMLPGMDGFEVCRQLRSEGASTPILVLTARNGQEDEVRALESGADDYLRKPFSYPVLVARLRTLGRRPPMLVDEVLVVGDLEIDVTRHVCRRDGVEIPLSSRELAIVELLALRRGAVVTKDEILLHAWPDEPEDVNLVEARVSSLRRKIDTPFGRSSVVTVRGAGYRLLDDRPTDQS